MKKREETSIIKLVITEMHKEVPSMNYLTSLQAAEQLGVTKRHINNMCCEGQIEGAYKDGYRWMIPEDSLDGKVGSGKRHTIRTFNTTGICDSGKHYMVALGQRLAEVKKLVDDGKYFTINRARQFGKTTTLHALTDYLSREYLVISMDFQMQMSNAKYKSENSFALAFAKALVNSFKVNEESTEPEYETSIRKFAESYQSGAEQYELVELFQALSALCEDVPKPIVLMIDEADSAANNQVFLDFLAQLRGYYINRSRFATFQSVILAGVYDVRNMKRKMRPDEEHMDNSPWNIAADFDIDMSFSPEQIERMLKDYEKDRHTGMDAAAIAQEIYDYTCGYPYLVSRICQLIDIVSIKTGRKEVWSHRGILDAVRSLVQESNSLFDDMAKKLKDYPELRNMLYDLLFCGRSIPFNLGTELISIGNMFGFLKEEKGRAAISNRIFEIWFYNLFIAEEAIGSQTYDAGERGREQFVRRDGLDMELILQKFVQHFTEVYGDSTDRFVEENGRKLFLLYIRPLINGTGNYYIESRTRSMGRTDLIIDYLGTQYIVEMKIWRGEEYNSRGESQLIGYLEDYGLKKGYMLSFNFNKEKETGVKEMHFKNYTVIEAVV